MTNETSETQVEQKDRFPTETAGLAEAVPPEVVELADAETFELEIAPVVKPVGDETVRMLAYNRSIPGPTLRVPEGSTVTVHVANQGDMEATVHWHGLRLENRAVAPFSRSETNYVAMGRFGEVMLVAGEPSLALTAQVGEVVRFYLTDTANTRVFRVGMRGVRMKLVGADSGRYEREEFVDEIVLAPSERAVVDVLFE